MTVNLLKFIIQEKQFYFILIISKSQVVFGTALGVFVQQRDSTLHGFIFFHRREESCIPPLPYEIEILFVEKIKFSFFFPFHPKQWSHDDTTNYVAR